MSVQGASSLIRTRPSEEHAARTLVRRGVAHQSPKTQIAGIQDQKYRVAHHINRPIEHINRVFHDVDYPCVRATVRRPLSRHGCDSVRECSRAEYHQAFTSDVNGCISLIHDMLRYISGAAHRGELYHACSLVHLPPSGPSTHLTPPSIPASNSVTRGISPLTQTVPPATA